MKKRTFLPLKAFLAAASALLLFSCSDSLNQTEPNLPSADGNTYLVVSATTASRAIEPTAPSVNDLTDILLTGTSTGKETTPVQVQANTFAELSGKAISIAPGSWNFTLTAKLNGVTYTGTTAATIQSGKTNVISFELAPGIAYGGMSITVSFTGKADKVIATLKKNPDDATAIATKEFTSSDFIDEGSGAKSVTFTRSLTEKEGLSAGTYSLVFDFHADGVSNALNACENFVRIANGITTTTKINWALNEVYTIGYEYYKGNTKLTDAEAQSVKTESGAALPQKFSRRSDSLPLPNLTFDGWHFGGWYSKATFEDADKITSIAKGSTGNKILYARFVELNTLYVSENGSDSNDGRSADTALATIATAIEKIKEETSALDWTITVTGTITGGQTVSGITTANAKSITIIGSSEPNSAGKPLDTLDGKFSSETNNCGTTLSISTEVPVTLKNITITGGNTMDNVKKGGGLFLAENADVTISTGTLITKNFATNGGGVYVSENATLRMTAGEISSNYTNDTANAYGGGIFVKGTVFMYGTAVIGNSKATATATTQQYSNKANSGAGVYVSGGKFYMGYSAYTDETTNTPAELTGGIFYNHAGSTGGGVCTTGTGSFIMHSGTVGFNMASSYGGGFATSGSSSVTVNGGAVSGNNGNKRGGGVYVYTGTSFTMNGGTINANTATNTSEGFGGGIATEGTVTMNGGTISGNTANRANGLEIIYSNVVGKLIMSGGTIDGGPGTGVFMSGPFTMSGSAKVSSVFVYTGAIKIAGKLTSSETSATLTPYQYNSGLKLIELADGVTDTTIKEAAAQFAIAQKASEPEKEWYLEEDGTLAVTMPILYVSGTGDDTNDGLSLDTPLESIDAACAKIIERNRGDLEWVIYIDGDVTGPHEGTNKAGSRRYTKDYGMSSIPAELTAEHAKSIMLAGVNGVDADGIPQDLINRGLKAVSGASGSATGVALAVQSKVPVTITSLLLTNGINSTTNPTSETVHNLGGGLYVGPAATVHLIDDVLITNNKATYGGGVYNEGTLYISGSAAIGNKTQEETVYKSPANSSDDGGGICNAGKLYLGYARYVSETDNTPEEWTGFIQYNYSWRGGAIKNVATGELVMNSGKIAYNEAANNSNAFGAGIYNLGSFLMTGGTIEQNRTEGSNGGGVYNAYTNSTAGVFTFAGGTIRNNHAVAGYGVAGDGGGVYNLGTMYVYGDAVIGDDSAPEAATEESHSNLADGNGGGIYVTNPTGKLYIGYSSYTSETENTPAAWNKGIFYNYAVKGGGALSIHSNATVVINSGTLSNNEIGTENKGSAVYLGSDGCTLHGTATVSGEIYQYSSYTLNIGDALSRLEDKSLTLTPTSDDAKTKYYSNQPVIKLTESAAAAGVTLATVIPKFSITPLVETATGKETHWIIDESTGKMKIKTSSGVDASLDTGTADIVVYRNGYGFTPPIQVVDTSGTICLDVRTIAGDSYNASTMPLTWTFDGQVLSRDALPAGVTFRYDSTDRQIDIDPKELVVGTYDVSVEAVYNGVRYSFTTQIVKK